MKRKTTKAVLVFGRFQPPTKGHEKLIDVLVKTAVEVGGEPFVVPSPTKGDKDPLSLNTRLRVLERFFPNTNVVWHEGVKDVFTAIQNFGSIGYTDIYLVGGSDRVESFQKLVRYIDHPDATKRLPIKSLTVVNAGHRDPDSDGVEGMSATKMRELAISQDFDAFSAGLPSRSNPHFAKMLYQEINLAKPT